MERDPIGPPLDRLSRLGLGRLLRLSLAAGLAASLAGALAFSFGRIRSMHPCDAWCLGSGLPGHGPVARAMPLQDDLSDRVQASIESSRANLDSAGYQAFHGDSQRASQGSLAIHGAISHVSIP